MVPGRSENTGGWADPYYGSTTSSTCGNTTTSTAAYTIYNDNYASNYNLRAVSTEVETFLERIFDKGKFFAFISSMEFRAWFKPPPIPKQKLKARHGHQQMCRLPCYRGVRTR